jgi:hypothetical protein
MSAISVGPRDPSTRPDDYGAHLRHITHTLPAQPELYSRVQYHALASFLSTPRQQATDENSAQAKQRAKRNETFPYIVVHTISPNTQTQRKDFNLEEGLQQFNDFPPPEARSTQIVFVRGSLSPSWTNALGVKYKIDPEFFRRHLRYLDEHDFSDQPSLSSTSTEMLTLVLPSLHVQDSPLSAREVKRNREQDSHVAKKNQNSITSRQASGETVVRKFTTLSDRFCSIEHEVAIFTRSKKSGGQIGKNTFHKISKHKLTKVTAVVLLDTGLEMNQEGGPPFFSRQESILLKKPAVGLKQIPVVVSRPSSVSINVTHPPVSKPETPAPSSSIDHAASFLPFYFGMSSEAPSADSNIFGLMYEIFRLVTSSECQFLNRLGRILDEQELEPVDEMQMTLTLSTIKCIRTLSEEHKQRLKRNIASLKIKANLHVNASAGGAVSSASASKPQDSGVSDHLTTTLGDFTELSERANLLCISCTEAVSLIVNGAMLRESQKAIQRADAQSRLTVFAYLFLPLTLVASVFGMNVKELNSGSQSIWLPFAVLGPVVLMSWALFYTGKIRKVLARGLNSHNSDHHTQGATMSLRTLKDNGMRMA